MTYEYVCTACSHHWEAEQPISASPLKSCPSCQAEAAKRQISGGAGFILKGGGWYADLYGSPKAAPKTESSGSETKPADTAASSTPTAKDTSTASTATATTPTKPSTASVS